MDVIHHATTYHPEQQIDILTKINNKDHKYHHLIRGLSVKFVDTANKTRIKYQRRMKFRINKYQLSGTMHTQYDSMFLHID